jgi:hypothetical protein
MIHTLRQQATLWIRRVVWWFLASLYKITASMRLSRGPLGGMKSGLSPNSSALPRTAARVRIDRDDAVSLDDNNRRGANFTRYHVDPSIRP